MNSGQIQPRIEFVSKFLVDNVFPAPSYIQSKFNYLGYFTYISVLTFLPIILLVEEELPIASAAILTCEQVQPLEVRLTMKIHAFTRETLAKLSAASAHASEEKWENPCPSREKLLYFLFVPTLVYKDSYPRRSSVDWRFVGVHLGQACACVVYVHFVFDRFAAPQFKDFGGSWGWGSWAVGSFRCVIPGAMVLVLLFWALLHCWMNAWAEGLRFADRHFYEDWWNSESFSGYYRKWNLIIHDWCYAYVYGELGGGAGAAFGVFLLSSLVHEFVLIAAHRLFLPVLLLLYAVFGVLFFFLSRALRGPGPFWNVAMWANLWIGNGIIIAAHSTEWYARRNCAPTLEGWRDAVYPRSWLPCQPLAH